MDNLNTFFDHTLLKVTSTEDDYRKLCDEAVKYKFYSVCIPPNFVSFTCSLLKNTSIKICSVVGFPSGLNTLQTKLQETEQLLKLGANEIDMVANLSYIKSGRWQDFQNEASSIKLLCNNNTLKVIVESSLLSKEEILSCCNALKDANVDFIKTSTGFNGEGAKIKDVKYMSDILKGSPVKIKASGGIRDLSSALDFINAGCSRIGSSSGVQIINQLKIGSLNETSTRSDY